MVKEITMYTIICDTCGVSSCEAQEYSCWNEEGIAREYAEDWIDHEGKDYCPSCYEYDDDDNPVIKTKSVISKDVQQF